MKKYLKIGAWLLGFIALIAMMIYAKETQGNQQVHPLDISIETPDEMVFLKEEDVIQRLKTRGIPFEHIRQKELNIAQIEHFVAAMPEVEHVDVFTNLNGHCFINIKIRRPIARIFNRYGESFYLDDQGKTMPLSQLYTANVLPVSGSISDRISAKSVDKIINNSSLKSISKLDETYLISNYVCHDPFLRAHITQMYVEKNGDFILIPRVGGQKIVFGKVKNDTIVPYRFDKLKLFYKKAMPIAGWNTYSIINLKFKEQIVCTKK